MTQRVTKVLLLKAIKGRGIKVAGLSTMKKADLEKLLGVHKSRVFAKFCSPMKSGAPRVRSADGKCRICPADMARRGRGSAVRCINKRAPRSKSPSARKESIPLRNWRDAVAQAKAIGGFTGLAKKGTPLYASAKKLYKKM
jgi:hypothetical protein